MKTYTLYKADNPAYKFKVYVNDNNKIKKIQFGASGYSDYTKHHDDDRKQRYIKRHYKNEDWNDLTTRGFWSYYILWNKKTVNDSYNDVLKKFNLKPMKF